MREKKTTKLYNLKTIEHTEYGLSEGVDCPEGGGGVPGALPSLARTGPPTLQAHTAGSRS